MKAAPARFLVQRLTACAAGLLASLAVASAATPSDTVAALSRIDLIGSTGRDVAAALAALDLPTPLCGGGTRSRPAAGLFVFMPLPPQCDAQGEVVGLNVGPLTLTAASTARLAAALAPEFGPPCFNGPMPVDSRRRAPALFMTAWAHGTRVLALTRAAVSSPEATVAYVDLTPRSERAGNIKDLFKHTLPPSCGGNAGG